MGEAAERREGDEGGLDAVAATGCDVTHLVGVDFENLTPSLVVIAVLHSVAKAHFGVGHDWGRQRSQKRT